MNACQHCGFCEADFEKLRNFVTDARCRTGGQSEVANLLEKALDHCECLRNLPEKDQAYARSINEKMPNLELEEQVMFVEDVQHTIREHNTKTTLRQIPHGFIAQYEAAMGIERSVENLDLRVQFLKIFPEECTETCAFQKSCPYYPQNIGSKCPNRFDLEGMKH
jgi:hypothetical protein